MSIINDALQKAEEIKKSGVKEIIKDANKPNIKLFVKDKRAVQHKWIYISGVLIILVFAILALFSRKESTVKENFVLPEIVPNTKLSVVEKIPLEDVNNDPLPVLQNTLPDVSEFKLTGMVLGEGTPMAIINDSVYMAGDMIKDLRIIEITKDTVSLEKDGRIIELRVK